VLTLSRIAISRVVGAQGAEGSGGISIQGRGGERGVAGYPCPQTPAISPFHPMGQGRFRISLERWAALLHKCELDRFAIRTPIGPTAHVHLLSATDTFGKHPATSRDAQSRIPCLR
jgi:hypothetical protein